MDKLSEIIDRFREEGASFLENLYSFNKGNIHS